MKKVIAVAAALMASSVQASSGLDFGDLNYFLKSGEFNLTSNINVVNSEFEDKVSSTRSENNAYIIDNRFTYGVADNLNAFVGLDYAYDNKTELSGSSRSTNDGISNPALGATYRLMSQKDSALNIDFGAVARFSLMDAETGTRGEDGAYNRGNHSIELNTSIGHKWNEANEWRLTAAVTQQFAGETEVQSNAGDTDIETDASTDFALTAAYQYRPVQEFMMIAALQAVRFGEVESEDKSANSDSTAESHIDYNFNFAAKYLINEKFIVRFNFVTTRLGRYDIETNGTDSEQYDRMAHSYGLGIDWLF